MNSLIGLACYIFGVCIGGYVGYKHGKKAGIHEGEDRENARVNRAIVQRILAQKP